MTTVNDRLLTWGHTHRTWRHQTTQRLRGKYPPVPLPTRHLNQVWPHLGNLCPRSARWPLNTARWWMARCGWTWTPWGWFFNRYIPITPRARAVRGLFVAAWTIVATLYAVVASMVAIAGLATIWAPLTATRLAVRAGLAWCGWIQYTPLPPSAIPDTIPPGWDTTPNQPGSDDPWNFNDNNDPILRMQQEGLRLQAQAVTEIRRANDIAERPTPPTGHTPPTLPYPTKSLVPALAVVAVATVALVLLAYHGAPDPGSWDTIHASTEAQP